MAGGVHSGHRQRMKDRYLTGGLDSFSPHEVIELMLYYAIPQRDVNDLSHRLIERFGSFAGVLEADYDDLLEVDGMGPNSALMFCLYRDVIRRYSIDKAEVPFVYDTIEKVGQYLVNFYVGVTVEKAYAMLFDNKMKLIDTVQLGDGSVNTVRLSMRTLAEKALKRSASSIILAHNHPNGTCYPSADDISLTHQLADFCEVLGLNLIDHVVVSGKYYTPILRSKKNAFMSAEVPSLDYGEEVKECAAPASLEGDKK
ncbi:MAG: RadC family protein [Clostridia bacterium]|nr:RadC family protein [Clostridia bacterium]